ncbi:18155_t:CDS:2 [Acaulospora morrowiae]|uniref:18155_t:CDS:1 n=1 Tax=Acaulospora morrowiae TaxID=94023 RepID=A0A9N8VNU1_9GLOM|nr:18155_t:CDS:2 [Acaulospora morrowiae]
MAMNAYITLQPLLLIDHVLSMLECHKCGYIINTDSDDALGEAKLKEAFVNASEIFLLLNNATRNEKILKWFQKEWAAQPPTMISIFPTKFQTFELVFLFLIINVSLHSTDADSTTQVATSTASTSTSAVALYDVSAPSQNSDITQSQIIQAAIGVSVTVLIIAICALYCYLYGQRTRRQITFISPRPARSAFTESAKRLEESSMETRTRFLDGAMTQVDRPPSFDSTQFPARPSPDNTTGVRSSVNNGEGDRTITATDGQSLGIGISSLESVNIRSEHNIRAAPSLSSSVELQAGPIEVN